MADQFYQNHNNDKQRVREVIAYVKKVGGLEYATEKMLAFKEEAMTILDNYPPSDAKNALTLMVNYVVERKI